MATTSFREDYLGRDITTPASSALDHLGRPTTSTLDFLGRGLRRPLRANSTAYALGALIQNPTTGEEFTVTVGGTSAASVPTAPAVGATVVDGTATLLRTA